MDGGPDASIGRVGIEGEEKRGGAWAGDGELDEERTRVVDNSCGTSTYEDTETDESYRRVCA